MAKTAIDKNQYTYLTNMANGRTETGGVANAGQRAWAKAQLANSTYTPPKTTSPATKLATTYPTTSTTAPNTTGNVGMSAVQAAAATAAKSFKTPTTATTTFTPRLEQTVNNFQKAVNTQFNYDPNSDQAFQSYLAQAKKALALNQANTNARLYANGQGDSSYSEALARQMANNATSDIANQMITTYLPQAYKQYQDNLANQQDLYNMQYQQDVTTPMNEAQLTGNYLPGPAREAIQNLVGLKQQAEAQGVTADQRNVLSQQADKIRSFLRTQGINPDLFASTVNSNQASQNANNVAGTRTLAGQEADLNRQNANLNAALNVGQASGRLLTPQSDWSGLYRQAANAETPLNYQAQQQQIQNLWAVADATGTIPDQLADMYGIPRGTPTQAAKQFAMNYALDQRQVGISAMNAATSRMNANAGISSDRFNQLMDVWKATGKAPSGLESYGIQAGQALPGTSTTSTSVSAKESANNLSQAKSNLSGLSKEEAMQYAQGIAGYLTDADYRSLLNYIDDMD